MEEELDEVEREEGTSEREKNQMLIPLDAYSVTKTPPPTCANADPYDRGSAFVTVHPGPPVELSQLVELTRGEFATLHP